MEIINSSYLQAEKTGLMLQDGSQGIVVVVKGSWRIPHPNNVNQNCHLLPQRLALPIQETDTFTGKPESSAPIFENDFTMHKPMCDVIMHACAQAPNKAISEKVKVGLEIENVSKWCYVTGKRYWEKAMAGHTLSRPEPFIKQPISYDIAFGGIDFTKEDDGIIKASLDNPVGLGYMPHYNNDQITGSLGPQTESLSQPIVSTNTLQPAYAFGPIGRSWTPRINYAGTYDENWVKTRRPLLPLDFDTRYCQTVPPDQQIPYPTGGEICTLTGVSEFGTLRFSLPNLSKTITVIDSHGRKHQLNPVVDTLIIEPELMRFSVVWRAQHLIHRTFTEVRTIIIDKPSKAWQLAQLTGKIHLKDKGKRP